MTVLKAINVDDAVFAEFKRIAKKEGRLVGKMFEIMIEIYKKQEEQNNGQSKNN